MQALKVAVIGMGVVLVVGFMVLVGAIIKGVGSKAASDSPGAAAAPSGYYEVTMPPPQGMVLKSATGAGAAMILDFAGPSGDRIEVLDAATGKITGTVSVPAAAK